MPLVLLNKTKVCFARFKLPSRVADKLTKYKHNAINHKHCYSIKGSLLSVQCVTDLRIGAFLNLIQRKLPLFCPRTGLRVLTITVIGIETIVHPTTLSYFNTAYEHIGSSKKFEHSAKACTQHIESIVQYKAYYRFNPARLNTTPDLITRQI